MCFYRSFIAAFTCICMIALLSVAGCSSAEKSAGMVLDSAASVVRSGDEKVWIDPSATAIPTPR